MILQNHMKKILISAGTIVVVAALAVGGTIAFYADTETSTGNIFTAGSIDLKVDHLAQTYNGVDCETCSVNVFSSTATQVIAGTGAYAGTYPTNAVELTFIHPAWLPEATVPPAQWIWVTNPVLAADTTNGAEYTFQKKFNWNGGVSGVTLDLALAADNGYKIVFNGIEVANALGTETNYGALVNTTAAEALILPAIQNGVNTLEITVRNKPGSSNPANNPAGLIFELNIQRDPIECEEDSAFQNACMLWTETDLDGSQTFFNFGDIKPGDLGTNVISLHVDSNDAYACLIVHDTDDQENSLLDPELALGDDNTNGNLSGFGELSDYLDLFAWNDLNGNGIYEPVGETSIYQGGIQTEIIQMILTGGGPTSYVGLAWCAGNIQVNHTTGAIGCNGAGMLNDAQSDSLTASLTAYAEQTRNNPGFSCANVVLPSTP
jgi:predicted ribosomally synthesized peptide with SipW-like signal peptide